MISLFILFSFGCKKEDTPEPSNNSTTTQPPPPTQSITYWGCWREATGNTGAYDIILIENQAEPHTLQFGTLCVGDPILVQDIGIFRNDTLILDNGMFEYWCFIENDTLLYSVYIPNAIPEKFVKI